MVQFAIAVLLYMAVIGQAVAAGGGEADSEGTIHLGIKLGPTNVAGTPTGFGMYGGYTILGPGTFKQNDFLSKLSIALESEYIDLGRTYVSNQSYKASTYGIVGAAVYPIIPQVSVIAKAGFASLTQTNSVACALSQCSVSTTAVGLHGGGAVQFNWTPRMVIRVGYDLYPDGYNMASVSVLSIY